MMILIVKLTKGIGHKFCQLMKSSPITRALFTRWQIIPLENPQYKQYHSRTWNIKWIHIYNSCESFRSKPWKVFLISLYLWHDIKTCSSVSTSIQNLQNRSSLGILGLLYLPRSSIFQDQINKNNYNY